MFILYPYPLILTIHAPTLVSHNQTKGIIMGLLMRTGVAKPDIEVNEPVVPTDLIQW